MCFCCFGHSSRRARKGGSIKIPRIIWGYGWRSICGRVNFSHGGRSAADQEQLRRGLQHGNRPGGCARSHRPAPPGSVTRLACAACVRVSRPRPAGMCAGTLYAGPVAGGFSPGKISLCVRGVQPPGTENENARVKREGGGSCSASAPACAAVVAA